jgi:phage terminase Nu1 subunit (DNA packaging protein)
LPQILSSWKEIANFFGKGVRTVQRWERNLGLPIYRPEGAPQNIVFARVDDLQKWMSARQAGPTSNLAVPEHQHIERMHSLLLEVHRNATRLDSISRVSSDLCQRLMENRRRSATLCASRRGRPGL